MTYPLVRDLAAEGIPVVVTCGVLGFSPQGYYRWLADPVTRRDWDDAHLVNAMIDIHAGDPEFGYRFIADELERAGWQVGRTGSHGCAVSTDSGRRRPARAARTRLRARRSTTTW